MIIDTSAWVEHRRATGSPTHLALRARVEAKLPIATPAPVVMELLSGSRSAIEAARLRHYLYRFQVLVPDAITDYQDAAQIYRTCRRAGFTIRSMIDCLVAAMAVNARRPLLAQNRDFNVIARFTKLELVDPSSPLG